MISRFWFSSYRGGVEMADTELIQILKTGVEHWNAWRSEQRNSKIDLRCANLSRGDLRGANFKGVDLAESSFDGTNLRYASFVGANLTGASFYNSQIIGANFRDAKLTGANLHNAYASYAIFSGADLSNANLLHIDLRDANLIDANLLGTDLRNANLVQAGLVRTNLSGANLEGCRVFGVSAWGLILDGANQKNLVITPEFESAITVDNLEVAQFIYLMLNNQKLRNVINTITTKAVLILGRFTCERKAILNAIREHLRQHDYLPIMFDFDQPATRDLTETVSTLAHMARFIIADITDAKSIPQELQAIIPNLPSVPVQPLLQASESEYGMFEHFKRYDWVLQTHVYESIENLIAELEEKVIAPAEAKAKELHS
jgi:uncharacterized protein YjbI with pentapeptide repeats